MEVGREKEVENGSAGSREVKVVKKSDGGDVTTTCDVW